MEKYMHVERLGNSETNGILNGKVYVFSKIDGTSGRVAKENGELIFGSRSRILDTSDNQGFKATLLTFYKDKLNAIFDKYNIVLYGEFLKPHTIRYYKEDAWNKFYIYDVWNNETNKWMNYDDYKPILDEFGFDYIPLICISTEFDTDTMNECLDKANFLLSEDKLGEGEGIVIKNYDFVNKYGRTTWAKIVRSEFKEQANHKGKVTKEIKDLKSETEFVDKLFTEALIEKEIWKIINNEENKGEFRNQLIPVILKTTFEEITSEEGSLINDLSQTYIGIDMKKVTSLSYSKIKKVLNEIVLPKLSIG